MDPKGTNWDKTALWAEDSMCEYETESNQTDNKSKKKQF